MLRLETIKTILILNWDKDFLIKCQNGPDDPAEMRAKSIVVAEIEIEIRIIVNTLFAY